MATIDSTALRNKASGLMSGFTTGQRFVVLLAVVVLVAGGALFSQWAAKPTMVPLFSNLSSEDASAITSKLTSQKVKYQITDEGHTIMVPQSKVYQLRLDMSSEGLPTGGSAGYSLLDKEGITTSEFRQHIDYQRALEGELSKTIGAISGVEAATVHLVIPKDDVFSDDSRKPSASVLVKTTPGKGLSGGQVQAVVNLVASAVEGLEPTNVTVADDKGRVLASPGQEASGSDDSKQTQTVALEDNLTKKIQSLLTPLVGDGKAVVQARAELNWDKTSTVSDLWNPTNRTPDVSSEHTSTETYANGDPTATGVLGPTGVPLNESATGSNGYSKVDTTKDYNNDHQVTQTQKAVGDIERISVSVLLDSNVPNIDPAEVQRVVTAAAGLQVARGDEVVVSRMPFDKTQADAAQSELKAAEKAAKADQTTGLIKTVATFLIVMVVLIVLFLTTRRRSNQYTSTPISMAELDAAAPLLDELGDGINGQLELDSPEAKERAKVDKEITDLIEKQPDEVASLLRSWLADRRG